MDGVPAPPRAVVVLVVGDRELLLLTVGGDVRCDVGLLDSLCRLRMEVRRLGWPVRLRRVDPELRRLFELAGLTAVLDEQTPRPRRPGRVTECVGGEPLRVPGRPQR